MRTRGLDACPSISAKDATSVTRNIATVTTAQILRPGLSPVARYAEVLGRGLGLFVMGWVVAGGAYFISGRTLSRETLAWTVVGVSVVAAVLARVG
jgi:hypothetical protein